MRKIGVDRMGVHAAHCCPVHGCKYGDEYCPVVLRLIKPLSICEDCESDYISLVNMLKDMPKDIVNKAIKESKIIISE